MPSVLKCPDDVIASANCGCVYHAKEGKACVHDLRKYLAREFKATEVRLRRFFDTYRDMCWQTLPDMVDAYSRFTQYEDRQFALHWKDGRVETVFGPTVDEAIEDAGYFGKHTREEIDHTTEITDTTVVPTFVPRFRINTPWNRYISVTNDWIRPMYGWHSQGLFRGEEPTINQFVARGYTYICHWEDYLLTVAHVDTFPAGKGYLATLWNNRDGARDSHAGNGNDVRYITTPNAFHRAIKDGIILLKAARKNDEIMGHYHALIRYQGMKRDGHTMTEKIVAENSAAIKYFLDPENQFWKRAVNVDPTWLIDDSDTKAEEQANGGGAPSK